MSKAKQILENRGEAQSPTSAAPLSFLDICEAIQGTLLKMSEDLQKAAGSVNYYLNEARRMKKEKRK